MVEFVIFSQTPKLTICQIHMGEMNGEQFACTPHTCIRGTFSYNRSVSSQPHLNWFSTKRAGVDIGEFQHFQVVLQISAADLVYQ
jgi:hypothetical protein